jgi:hypothetical protein
MMARTTIRRVMMPDDPWLRLDRPSETDAFTARRVDSNDPWSFFWGVDSDGACMLLLQHTGSPVAPEALPKLRDIEVFERSTGAGHARLLGLRLSSDAHRDIFLQFCLDIGAWARLAGSEAEAVSRVLGRMWRWHHLLRGGSADRLSDVAQKGLVGELTVLEQCVLPHVEAKEAVESWVGPLDAHRDFEFGGVAIEVKARRADHPFVEISSEFQLDQSSERLFLVAVEVDRALTGEGLSLTALAARVLERLQERDPEAADLFEARLAAAGFTWQQDYSDVLWQAGERALWLVDGAFPRIRAADLPEGVSDVRYVLALTHLLPFQAGEDELAGHLTGGTGPQ